MSNLTTRNWHNSDGLFIRFGTDEVKVNRGGEYSRLADGTHCVEVTIDLVTLPAFGSYQIVAENVTIPVGAFIEQIDVIVVEEPTEASGTDANLDLGLVDQNRTTEIDADGFLAAADAFHAGTDLGAKVTYVKGTTEAGALVGTRITNAGYIVAGNAHATDVWTDGTVKARIFYSVPLTADL